MQCLARENVLEKNYSLCSMDLYGFAIFQFSMDLCAFSYVMLRVKLRMYVSSLPYSTNLTYHREIYFILLFAGTVYIYLSDVAGS